LRELLEGSERGDRELIDCPVVGNARPDSLDCISGIVVAPGLHDAMMIAAFGADKPAPKSASVMGFLFIVFESKIDPKWSI